MSLRFATFCARTSLAVIALFTLSFFPPARTAELTLQVLPLRPNQPPQFRLNGEGSTYVVQTSTNLTSWTIFRSLTTTNGTADFSYENNPQGVLFLRAVQEALPEISVELKVAEDFIFTTLLTAEGGSVEFPTPDLRTMILFFPTNSVIRPTEITISVVTNFAGSPFAQGGFGGVKLEPENLSLGAAATLTIPFPAGTDGRTVLSFATQNDGTLFSLFPDRALSNEVVIPFTRLATYGSSVATTSEAEVLLGPIEPGPADSSGILSASSLGLLQRVDPACVYLRRNQSFGDASQFNQTSRDCYDVLVDRALAVQRELRLFLTCGIQADIAQAIGIQRQRELLVGEEAGSLDYSSVTNEICKLYNETIEPLWKEATNNCPLAGVLLQFMLGFEQQMQTLGITNVPCNYTVFGNLDKLCASAAECLSEIKTCCALGHRGQQKYLEIVDILKQFDVIGDSNCFPKEMDDDRVRQALDVCMTNAWYGWFAVTEYADTTKITREGNTETREHKILDLKYSGGVFKSDESVSFPGIGKTLNLIILGTGIVKLEDTLTSIQRIACPSNSVAINRYFGQTTTTDMTNGYYDPNFATAFGAYHFGIIIQPDNTTYQVTSIGGPMLSVKAKDYSYGSSENCEGKVFADEPDLFESSTGAVFPMLFTPITRPMSADTNQIHGTHRVIDDSGNVPVPIDFTWNFRRVLNR